MQSRKKSISFMNFNEDKNFLAIRRFNNLNSKLDQMENNDNIKRDNQTEKLNKFSSSLSILKKPKSSILKVKEISKGKINSDKKFSLPRGKNKFFNFCSRKYTKKIYITRKTLVSESKIQKNEMLEKVSKRTLKDSAALLLNNKRLENKDEYFKELCPQLNLVEHNFLEKSIQDNITSIYLVEIRAVVLKLGGIDTLNEKFYAEAFIEAKWVDVRKKFASNFQGAGHIVKFFYF